MNRILLVIKREYLTRVRKRSFVVMTILGPLLMASAFVVPMYLATMDEGDVKVIKVVDETGWFFGKFANTDEYIFNYSAGDLETAKAELTESGEFALLYIPRRELTVPASAVIYSLRPPNIGLQGYIKNVMSKEVETQKLRINLEEMDLKEADRERAMKLPELIRTNISLVTMKIGQEGAEEQTYTEVMMAVAFVSGLIIYMFIFIFGAQVLRGVMEEKTSRIIEIMASSVRPFQLMMGKIIGIAMVGLTQFLLWVILTFALVSVFQFAFADSMPGPEVRMAVPVAAAGQEGEASVAADAGAQIARVFEIIDSIQYDVILLSFLFFFLGGYLLYAALFAAIGSAVDSETDTQQFMMPVTIPLILAIIVANLAIANPDGQLALWFSMIPFTSPVVMMARIPFGVPIEQIWISAALLILGFVFTTWLAARIYRTGILMYGKKVNYRELWKWITYRK
jgi:ABC-2 type transport system permease protein